MRAQLRQEQHDPHGRRNKQHPEVACEGIGDQRQRRIDGPLAYQQPGQQQHEPDDWPGQRGQQKSRQKLAQPLKKQNLDEPCDHGAP